MDKKMNYPGNGVENTDILMMRLALSEARRAAEEGETPIGAVLVRGEEIIGIAPLSGPKTEREARPEKDVWFYNCELQPLKLFAGSFMIFYPGDIHAPGIPGCDPVRCRKIVMKIKFD